MEKVYHTLTKKQVEWKKSPPHRCGEAGIIYCQLNPAPSCARRSAHRHSEGEALGGETENLLQIKQFSILRISKRVRNKFMYITTHLIDFITIILGRGGLFKPRHGCFLLFFFHHADEFVKTGAFRVGHFHSGLCGDFSRFPRGINLVPVGGEGQRGSA